VTVGGATTLREWQGAGANHVQYQGAGKYVTVDSLFGASGSL
jgi:hypothetical protein